ncbi:MAG: hypothetical protein LC799_10795, partial [Actinobacteria bacterium]|nr:hypothetical protein [Actinomycetota bacterium]
MRFSRSFPLPASRRRLAALSALGVGAVLLVVTAVGLTVGSDTSSPVAHTIGVPVDPLSRSIAAAQERLRSNPDDAITLAQLGSAYVEQARVTADPSYYERAQG